MNGYCYCHANLVINWPGEPIFAEEVWHADQSKRKQIIAMGIGKGGCLPNGLQRTSGMTTMRTTCG
ncbi:hypothetical protein A7K73_10605 [Candidatus Methylacidiphilum fumarolicum]|uniref:Uncharacterized protein n=1 Tax=Candidatus Methylacidiphilum fumarolicum TaxID=591154 RepID=A0ABM9ID02_9BACT|nr:hypothetical protein [Candidatus Methylacidiphilum fumarolicum]MBW6414338.1 hypothetical protein [Candidatus Methylacidiphilum fumarolicum]TFE66237.1 hypothetical protein A7K73_10605 [Candidatus Methylacidiphilum fumarolicum]TFE75117.1 hypothetical protein A7K72_02700 [Candidatus Methylacidiphilum fumarolicum]TFE76338.1 hypothetical protein A7D33_10400 [Candidatus Methylacidiphilum fumarolicum]CAI9085557.1 conserved protein of unknown function [Candidatus Methylacidiphilum fumarolicum]